MDYMPDEPMVFAPIRSLSDFLTESARFQLPSFNDGRRFSSRILNNLLYYQTNYFVLFFVLFTLSWCMRPKEVGLGLVALIAVGTFLWYLGTSPGVVKFKEDHPIIFVVVITAVCLLIARLSGVILSFVSAFLLPVLLILVHAATRMRNAKNKMENKLEKLGLNRPTPMGVILVYFGNDRRFANFLGKD